MTNQYIDSYNFDRCLDLMISAFNAKNHVEASQFADQIIYRERQDSRLIDAWIIKGYCAGYLSTPLNCRIEELLFYVKKAIEAKPANVESITFETLKIAGNYSMDFLSHWADVRFQEVNRIPPPIIAKDLEQSLRIAISRQALGNNVNDIASGKYFENFFPVFLKLIRFCWEQSPVYIVGKSIILNYILLSDSPILNNAAKSVIANTFQPILEAINGEFPSLYQDELKTYQRYKKENLR